jgi:hypothetical protein
MLVAPDFSESSRLQAIINRSQYLSSKYLVCRASRAFFPVFRIHPPRSVRGPGGKDSHSQSAVSASEFRLCRSLSLACRKRELQCWYWNNFRTTLTTRRSKCLLGRVSWVRVVGLLSQVPRSRGGVSVLVVYGESIKRMALIPEGFSDRNGWLSLTEESRHKLLGMRTVMSACSTIARRNGVHHALPFRAIKFR